MKAPPLAEVFARQRHACLFIIRPAEPAPAQRPCEPELPATGSTQPSGRCRRGSTPRFPRPACAGVSASCSTASPSSSRAPRSQGSHAWRAPQVWPSIGYHTLLDKTPQIIGAPTVWGPTLATAGQGVKIAIVDDGIDQTHPFFAPAGYAYPRRLSEGSDRVYDAEGDRRAGVRSRDTGLRQREAAVRPRPLRPRHPRRRHRSGKQQHADANRRLPTLRHRAPRLPRQLQSARHPERVRRKRECTGARRRHRGCRARRHGRHQPVARGDRDRPESRRGCKGPQRGRRCGGRLDGLGRQ